MATWRNPNRSSSGSTAARNESDIRNHLMERAECDFDDQEAERRKSPGAASSSSRRRPAATVYRNVDHLIKYVNSAETQLPDTVKQLRQQRKENAEKCVEANGLAEESYTYFVSGRGKAIRDRIIRPGEVIDYEPNDDVELRKRIREVSGLGYSNEYIEESFKATDDIYQEPAGSELGLKFVSVTDYENLC